MTILILRSFCLWTNLYRLLDWVENFGLGNYSISSTRKIRRMDIFVYQEEEAEEHNAAGYA